MKPPLIEHVMNTNTSTKETSDQLSELI